MFRNFFIIVAIVCTLNLGKFSFAEPASCETVADLAENIMGARQQGVSASVLLNALNEEVESPDAKEIIKILVVAAYEQPRFDGSEYRQNAINDFRDEVYIGCIK